MSSETGPPETASSLRRPVPGAMLAFLAAFSTLFTQILVHRMVSAKLENNYAFLVISLTMLGFAVSGVALTLGLRAILARLEAVAAASAALFAVTAVGASALFYRLDAGPQFAATRPEFVLASFRWMSVSLLYSAPFFFCGLVLGALLAVPELPTRRTYFADLVGSALGALLVLPAIGAVGVEKALLLCCTVFLVATLLLARPRGPAPYGLSALGVLAIVAGLAFPEHVFRLRYPAGSMLDATQHPESGWRLEHVAWDALGRIEVTSISPQAPHDAYPSLTGSNRGFLGRFQKMLTQNNNAFTYAVHYDGQKRSLQGIEETVYAAAYHATSVPRPKVAIIGVGGGFDVLTALAFDAREIAAVEINSAIVRIVRHTYRDYFRHWVADPRVRLVAAEGRHFLATSPDRFDVVQLSGVDSYSGTPGAAHVFSENYLYTAEAFDLYLSRLTDAGIFNMMRLEHRPPREMLKALVLAVGALRRAGATHPARHLVTLTQPNGRFTALLVKKAPFSAAELDRLRSWADANPHLDVSSGPNTGAAIGGPYQLFLSFDDAKKEAGFVRAYPFDIAPVEDDRPFFFRHSRWWHLFPADPVIWGASLPVMEYSVILLTLTVGLAAIACVYAPLRFLAARGLTTPRAGRHATFFAGTAVGYMAIEIALLQKYGLFLGHPNHALSVVLTALLFSTGLGSLVSETIVRLLGRLRFVSYLVAGVVLSEHLLLLPVLPQLLGWTFAARALLVFALVAPIGVCLGTFVPTALERLKRTAPAFVPWAWGVNGIFSVLAPALSVAFSMSWGIGALLVAALPFYLLVGLVAPGEAPAPH